MPREATPSGANGRERLRRAVDDGERLYRVRMHGEPTIADDNRINGILTLDLIDAEIPMTGSLYKSAEACPDRAKHTSDPPGYLAWHEWAEKKARTHTQHQCPMCGFWVIWKRKRKVAA